MRVSISELSPEPLAVGHCMGWFYPGTGVGAVLLCGSIEFEAFCARQSWHALAGLISTSGPSVLRIDYPGEGDALDRDAGESILDAAAVALRMAADALRKKTGTDAISLVAMRAGVPIAVQAFEQCAPFNKIVLLEPVFDGRSYVRELKATARILNELRPVAPGPEGALNVCGFVLGATDVADFSAVKLVNLPAGQSLHIAHDNRRALPEWLPAHQTLPFDDFSAMNVPPTQAQVPVSTFKAVAALFATPQVGTRPAPLPALAKIRHGTFVETAIRFGQSSALAGVLCEPETAIPNAPIVHILNAGANSHVGWARMGTEHARALAGVGIASLRYDFKGIGDSVWQGTNGRELVYAPTHIDDALAAVEETCSRGYESAVLSGLCSGGYIAFRTAARDRRISGVISANTLRLIWHPHDTLDAIETGLVQADKVYRDKIFSTAEWKRLILGGISPRRIYKVARAYSGRFVQKIANATGFEQLDADNRDVRANLTAIVENGASVVLVHSDRDQSELEAQRHFGPGAAWALKHANVRRVVINDADHELSQPWARDKLLETIVDMVRRIQTKI